MLQIEAEHYIKMANNGKRRCLRFKNYQSMEEFMNIGQSIFNRTKMIDLVNLLKKDLFHVAMFPKAMFPKLCFSIDMELWTF